MNWSLNRGKYDGRVLNSVISEKATNPPKHYTQASSDPRYDKHRKIC